MNPVSRQATVVLLGEKAEAYLNTGLEKKIGLKMKIESIKVIFRVEPVSSFSYFLPLFHNTGRVRICKKKIINTKNHNK